MELPKYKRIFFMGIILISLGVVMSTSLDTGSIGTVFIAVGGLFFIAAMSLKKKEEK